MVIGLKCGTAEPGDEEAKEKTYRKVREFLGRFRERHATILCRKLLKADIGTTDGLTAPKGKRLFTGSCTAFVRSAAEILQEVLSDDGQRRNFSKLRK